MALKSFWLGPGTHGRWNTSVLCHLSDVSATVLSPGVEAGERSYRKWLREDAVVEFSLRIYADCRERSLV